MPYAVSTPVFEGPFDLLLHLILQEEVDIHEVSLSRIVEAYLAELERMKSLDLEVATEFVLIAATLIDLKTRRLLPTGDDGDLDEELALWEERDILLARLLDCKTFKDVATVMHDLIERAELSQPRLAGPDERFETLMPDLLEGVTPLRLQRAFFRATEPKAPVSIDLFHVAPIRASVADALEELLGILPTSGPTSFRTLRESPIASKWWCDSSRSSSSSSRVEWTWCRRNDSVTLRWCGIPTQSTRNWAQSTIMTGEE
ncbi:MAG: segregation and condensation protein A [Ilumatobacteraceae bacterium]